MTTRRSRRRPPATETATETPAPRPSDDEFPPAAAEVSSETQASAAEETVTQKLNSHTCVFCNQGFQVDLEDLAGGRFIAEPSLSIRHYVCPGCNDA